MTTSMKDNDTPGQTWDIDALLHAAAQQKTSELELMRLLPRIHESARKPAAIRPKAFHLWAISPVAVVLLLILGFSLFARMIVVDGKTYLAVNGNVTIAGIVHNVNSPKDRGKLVLLEDNQYVLVDGVADSIEIMVFAPGAKPGPTKRPGWRASREQAVSIEPIRVFPVINSLVIRKGPGMQYEELGVLCSGQILKKMGMDGKWAVIEWQGGAAYVYDEYLFDAPETTHTYDPVERYATEPVYVRALPTSRSDSCVLGELQAGEQVSCTGTIGDWVQIEYQGNKAYVFKKYLRR